MHKARLTSMFFYFFIQTCLCHNCQGEKTRRNSWFYCFFLQTERNDEELLLSKLKGVVVLLVAESNPDKWRNHLIKENEKWTIYVTFDRGIYGTMNSALLADKKLSKVLKSLGIIMNPFDPWAWHKMVNQKQLTVIFHMCDLIISFA